MAVVWYVALCDLVQIDHSFGGPYCLHYQVGESLAIFIFISMIT